MHFPLSPHGGELINTMASATEREIWLQKAAALSRITLNERELSDIDMIACGALSPLRGFM